MNIERLKLVNFRNYENTDIKFFNKINILYGENAQGKTNILEAINICSIGKSIRFTRDIEAIQFGKESYYIELDLNKNNRSCKIEVGVNNKKEKRIKVFGKEIKKLGELLGKLVVVLFSPDELKIVKDSPFYRRRFIDILICQLSTSYMFNLQQFYKIAAQRNNLLKQIKKDAALQETLDTWDKKYAEFSAKIIKKRREFIKKINEKSFKVHNDLTEGKENLKIIYKSTIDESNKDESEIAQKIEKQLLQERNIDISRGFSQIGPHRENIIFLINGKDAGKYCSQGQQRTIILSLKLAEMEIIKEEIEETPILLLDDVFSELDNNRRKYLIKYIKEAQVFITSTENIKEGIEESSIKSFKVENGKIIKNQ